MEEKLTVLGFLLKLNHIAYGHKISLFHFSMKAEISQVPSE